MSVSRIAYFLTVGLQVYTALNWIHYLSMYYALHFTSTEFQSGV